MKNDVLVSIITPSYNQGKFIEDCILSIKNQTFSNIEHIIVDGGSTDNTLQIIKKYEGTYNVTWISEHDSGMYDAINKGIKISNGNILAYLNCDDLYFPWTVELAVKHLQEYKLVYGELLNINLKTKKIKPHYKFPFYFDFYASYEFINQPTVFFKREVIEKVGLFNQQEYKLVADCEYWLRCAKAGIKPKKIWQFMAIEQDHDLIQRDTKRDELLREIEKFRTTYGGSNYRYRRYCYMLMYIFFHQFCQLLYHIPRITNTWKYIKHDKKYSCFKYSKI